MSTDERFFLTIWIDGGKALIDRQEFPTLQAALAESQKHFRQRKREVPVPWQAGVGLDGAVIEMSLHAPGAFGERVDANKERWWNQFVDRPTGCAGALIESARRATDAQVEEFFERRGELSDPNGRA